jgi:hypothetical protein
MDASLLLEHFSWDIFLGKLRVPSRWVRCLFLLLGFQLLCVDLNVLISGNNGEIDLELLIDGNYDRDAYRKHRFFFNESDHFLAQDKPKCSPKNTLLVISSRNIKKIDML